MGTKAIAHVVMGTMLLTLVCGCAVFGKGPSDEELITKTLNEWKAGVIAKDIEAITATYSDNFTDGEGRNKEAMKNYVQNAIDMGYLDDAEVGLDATQITITEEDATAAPIDLQSPAGSLSLTFTLKKEGKAWMIVGTQ